MKLIKYLFIIVIFPFVCAFTNIAHRGDNGLGKYAEHSFLAYDQAVINQADYIELDIQKTKDNVLVVSHDDNLSRVFGVNLDIGQTNYQTLSKYRNQSGEKLHTLKEVFARYQADPRIKFMVETKNENAPVGMEHELVNLIKSMHLEKRILFESFSLQSLSLLKKLAPSIPRTMLGGDYHDIGQNQYFADGMYSKSAAQYLNRHGKGYIIWGLDQTRQIKRLVNNPLVSAGMTDFAGQLARFDRADNLLPIHPINGKVTIQTPFALVQNSFLILKRNTQVPVSAITQFKGQLYYEINPGQLVSAEFVQNKEFNRPVTKSGFLYLKKAATVYQDPTDLSRGARSLRAGSHWNYYAYFSGKNGKFYNLGGNQWISAKAVLKVHPFN